MKNIALFLTFFILSSCFHSTDAKQLTVMTYNVHNGVGLDKKRDYIRIGNIIKEHQPDFVGIQEVDSATRRSNNSFVLNEIATAAGMHHIFAPAIDFDGGRYGIGLLTKTEPDSVSTISLPGREESRMMLMAHFPNVVVINTHLSLTAEDALASVGILENAIKKLKKPVILMGDLNSLPGSAVITALKQLFTIVSPDAPTFPANNPTERIDYIMISAGTSLSVISNEVIDEPEASDHRPVISVVEL